VATQANFPHVLTLSELRRKGEILELRKTIDAECLQLGIYALLTGGARSWRLGSGRVIVFTGFRKCRFLEDFRIFQHEPRPFRHPLQRLGVGKLGSREVGKVASWVLRFQNVTFSRGFAHIRAGESASWEVDNYLVSLISERVLSQRVSLNVLG